MSTNQLIIEHVSPFNVPVTVEKLIEVAKLKGWQNPAVHNLQQSLAKSGKDVLPVEVVEICKPANPPPRTRTFFIFSEKPYD